MGKVRQGCQNNSLRWQKNNWGKWLFTSYHLILDIVMSHRTKFFGFWLKISDRDVNTAFFRIEMNKLRKDIFFWKTLSVSISFRILRKTILDIQQKKARPPQLHLTCPEAKMYEKRFFLEYSQFYSFVRTVTETHSKFRLKILLLVLQTACTCPNERFERNDFLSKLSKSTFLQTLSGKYPAPL